MNLMEHEDITMNNEDRIKCYELMREYGLKCSEFLFGHGWHMSDVPKEQWFVFITSEDIDYIRIDRLPFRYIRRLSVAETSMKRLGI